MKIRLIRRLLLIVFLICITGAAVFLSGCSKDKENPKTAFENYKKSWETADYKGMYGMLSSTAKGRITKEQFIERYEKVNQGIEANNLSVKPQYPDKIEKTKENEVIIPFSISMDTIAGNITVEKYQAVVQKEKLDKKEHWVINWSESMIFPELDSDDKVRANTIPSKRGEILDRNGKGLAVNGTLLSVDIDPKNFEPDKEIKIKQIAQILDIPEQRIKDKLQANTNPEWRVAIVNISLQDVKTKDKLYPIIGVIFNRVDGRVYPGGEAFGSLIGYTGPITAEELEKVKSEGYNAQSKIGKLGLEQVYEKRLKGESGGEIYISKIENGKETEKIAIARKEPKNGEKIKVAVDSDLQMKIYNQMKGEPGSAVAVDPKTGEVLALVSSPNFDSNIYSTYITQTIAQKLKDTEKNPTANRFNKAYAPGSTFKLITTAIGLDTGAIKPEETFNITGTQWQPDGSWGNYKVTRVKPTSEPINLLKAFMYSDNIYFAMQALKIGKDDFIAGSKKFGLGEELPIDFPFQKSQLMNGTTIDRDTLLADSAFGQGEVLMSPLHVSLAYSALANNGDIMQPILELKGDTKPSVWKKKAINPDNINTLTQDLIQVIESPNGTGHEVKIQGMTLAGKTGTAQLQKDTNDTDAEENGWFVAFDTNNPKFVITMIVEKVKKKGGSHYIAPMVKGIFQ